MLDSLKEQFACNYAPLQAMARARLRGERAPISTGTLVHELYLSMHQRDSRPAAASRQQFLAYAAKAMRSILVDMARERSAQKRSADVVPLETGVDAIDPSAGRPEDLLALAEAIEQLGRLDQRLMQVADLRAVLGLEVSEIADVLGVSEPTVKRDWQRAKAFLFEKLGVAA